MEEIKEFLDKVPNLNKELLQKHAVKKLKYQENSVNALAEENKKLK